MNALRTAIESLNSIKVETQKRTRLLAEGEKAKNQENAELISVILLKVADGFVGSAEDSFDNSYINLYFHFVPNRKTDIGVLVGLGFKFPNGSCTVFTYLKESENRSQLVMGTRSVGLLAKNSVTKDVFTLVMNVLDKLEQKHPFPFQPPTT
jgi:hypothetical protein